MSSIIERLPLLALALAAFSVAAPVHANGIQVTEHVTVPGERTSAPLDAAAAVESKRGVWVDELAFEDGETEAAPQITLVEIDLDAEVDALGYLPGTILSENLRVLDGALDARGTQASRARIGDFDLAALPAVRVGLDLPQR